MDPLESSEAGAHNSEKPLLRSSVRPTILERVLSRVHLGFISGTILVFLLIGPLGNYLFSSSVSFELDDAFYATFGLANDSPVNPYLVASTAFWFAFLLFVCFSVRHLRLRLAKAEPVLVSLAPDGEATVSSVFRFASSAPFQLAIAAMFLIVYMTSVPGMMANGEFTLLSGSVYVFRSLLRSVVFGSVLGLCFGTLWGLYQFGRKKLRLIPFSQDRWLGARELGSLSFTFTSIYFVGLTLFTIQAVLGGMTGASSIVNLLFMTSLPPLGVVLLLAPLVSAHHRMAEVKANEVSRLREQSEVILNDVLHAGKEDNTQYPKLLALEALEKKTSSIPTWPFATHVLGQLVTVMLSVVALVVFRIIQIVFGI